MKMILMTIMLAGMLGTAYSQDCINCENYKQYESCLNGGAIC